MPKYIMAIDATATIVNCYKCDLPITDQQELKWAFFGFSLYSCCCCYFCSCCLCFNEKSYMFFFLGEKKREKIQNCLFSHAIYYQYLKYLKIVIRICNILLFAKTARNLISQTNEWTFFGTFFLKENILNCV